MMRQITALAQQCDGHWARWTEVGASGRFHYARESYFIRSIEFSD